MKPTPEAVNPLAHYVLVLSRQRAVRMRRARADCAGRGVYVDAARAINRQLVRVLKTYA